MSNDEPFKKAVKDVLGLAKRPSNEDLLSLYGLYKQATEGDATGARPGLLDIKGRKKFDAWVSCKGKSAEAAKSEYIALVGRLMSA